LIDDLAFHERNGLAGLSSQRAMAGCTWKFEIENEPGRARTSVGRARNFRPVQSSILHAFPIFCFENYHIYTQY